MKLKHQRKKFKILYISTVVASVSISTVVTLLAGMISIPVIVITTLSAASGTLTGLSAKFNLQNKKVKINNLIDKLNKIQSKLD